jgi:hypothetical protein
MNAIDMNFATAPFRNNTPYYLGYGLGTLALIAFTTYNSWAFFAYSESRALLESDQAAKKVKLEQLYQDTARLQEQIKKENLEAVNSRAAFTNGLLDRRRFSWTDLLNSLEEIQPYQVRLLSLLPRIQDKGILIDARAVAKDLQAFWNFQQNLQNHPKFRRVYPGGYQRIEDTDEYIFNIQFNYFPKGAPADVEGIAPEEFQIVQAPGAAAAGEGEEEAVEEEPPAPAPEAPPPPKRAASREAAPAGSGPKALPQFAGGAPPQGPAPAPAGGAQPPRLGQPPQTPGAVPPPALGGLVAGAPAPPGASANPSVSPPGGAAPRWPVRGALPGAAGQQRPPAPGKSGEGAPKVPVIQQPQPTPDEGDESDNEGEGDDEGDEGDGE